MIGELVNAALVPLSLGRVVSGVLSNLVSKGADATRRSSSVLAPHGPQQLAV